MAGRERGYGAARSDTTASVEQAFRRERGKSTTCNRRDRGVVPGHVHDDIGVACRVENVDPSIRPDLDRNEVRYGLASNEVEIRDDRPRVTGWPHGEIPRRSRRGHRDVHDHSRDAGCRHTTHSRDIEFRDDIAAQGNDVAALTGPRVEQASRRERNEETGRRCHRLLLA